MSKSERRNTFLLFLPEIGCMIAAALGIFLLEYTGIIRQGTDNMFCDGILVVLGIGVSGFDLRMSILRGELDKDNAAHWKRFWLCFLIGLVIAFASVFLPAGAWPFLAIFVLLGLFGSRSAGVLSGAVLLAIPVLLTNSGIEIYILYLISGLFGIVLFGRVQNGSRIGSSFFLSLGCLLVCITAGTVLLANAHPDVEQFLVPAANLVVSGILLFGIVKYYSSRIVYRYRDAYLDLNDPESEILVNVRQQDKRKYMQIVHTTYFCERIAIKLGLDQDALKCAGYYHALGEQLKELLDRQVFPPEAAAILREFADRGKPIRRRETAVLVASKDIVGAIVRCMEAKKDGPVDYDKLIDGMFEKYRLTGAFDQCDITVSQLRTMQKIFKEEKLYYDFLR